jgi:pimeloyl-ACP methyl ester carboxylesterase
MKGCPAVHHRAEWLVLSALLLLAGGCYRHGMRALTVSESPIMQHAIFVDNDGRPLFPSTTGRARSTPGKIVEVTDDTVIVGPDTVYERYVGNIMAGIRADSARRGKAPRLLLRIHGGLNSLDESLDATMKMTTSIMADSATNYYPLFINWESGLMSAYGEHLFFLRSGRSYSARSLAPLAFPFYLAADLGAGIVRAPLTMAKQFAVNNKAGYLNNQGELLCGHPDDLAAAGTSQQAPDTARQTAQTGTVRKAERSLCAPLEADGVGPRVTRARSGASASWLGGQKIALSRFAYHRSKMEWVVDNGLSVLFSYVPTRYFVMVGNDRFGNSLAQSYRASSRARRPLTLAGWLPPKVIGLIVIDGLGSAAWSTMHRRTHTMVRPSTEFTEKLAQTRQYVPETGGLPIFLDSLQELLRKNRGYHLTLVGHSMGAIVATEVIRARDSLRIDNIVFMASAASVRETATSVVPYLEHHPRTQFYNLTLHPWSEAREWAKGPVLPYGSLLEWIDAYFGNPETPEDLMVGKYDTAIRTASELPPAIRGQVHIKAFGYHSGKGCGAHDMPFKHGQFNDDEVPFWRFGFWVPDGAGCKEVRSNPALATKE